MKCGNALTKRHLNVCPAKDFIRNTCKYKGHFGRLCKSKAKNPTLNSADENVNNQNCQFSPSQPQSICEENFCGVIIA